MVRKIPVAMTMSGYHANRSCYGVGYYVIALNTLTGIRLHFVICWQSGMSTVGRYIHLHSKLASKES